jgi:hypothetical protein
MDLEVGGDSPWGGQSILIADRAIQGKKLTCGVDVPSSATNPKTPETLGFGGQIGIVFNFEAVGRLTISNRIAVKIESSRASPVVLVANPQITCRKTSKNSPPSRNATCPTTSSR